jgi:hypothetical protein
VYLSQGFLLETPLSSLALDSRQYDLFLLNQIVFVTKGALFLRDLLKYKTDFVIYLSEYLNRRLLLGVVFSKLLKRL